MGWYARMEREGILNAMGTGSWGADRLALYLPTKDGEPAWFAEAKRDRAADLGTITHARIEAWLTGEELDPDGLPTDLYDKSANGFDRFRRWWDGKGFRLAGSELQMVSETMRVGGTMDVAATRDEYDGHGIAVVDIKSSKSSLYWPYKEHKSQGQTYGRIWTELHAEPVHEVWVYRCGTTPSDSGQEYQLTDKQRKAGDMLFDGALMSYRAARDLE
jgi:hypothetical protein